MKIIINDNQAGFVTKNGRFVKMLRAGKYHFSNALGYKVYIEDMSGELDFEELPYQILEQDSAFKEATVRYEIPDGQLGFVYVNDKLQAFAVQKEYIFWNVFEKYEVRLISTECPEIGGDVTKSMLSVVPVKYYTSVSVGNGEVGLLYYDNVFQRQLEPGEYAFWNDRYKIKCYIIDMKLKELDIVGQEILTKDKIGIRMNVSCTYRINNPVELASSITNLEKQMYTSVQLVIRELTGNYKLDEILELKDTISKEVFEKMQAQQNAFCVEFHSAGIKDIILPGEIREIMNSVLVAEKTAQANVIARREEVASTRSLLNTAKLMDENKTLYRLKELEYMEKICDKVGEISVGGNAGLVEQLGRLAGCAN
ncbi:MAG: slipin family protein [Lachnospiraceae bacterium]|nr:slipin family protein [Lachnospiraceae bacterium]